MNDQAMFHEAASAVLENFYMDTYLDSFEEPNVAFKMSQELITLLALGGFKLTKFISNVTKIDNELSPSEIDDTLVASRGVNQELKISIKQQTVLNFVSSVFDPIGHVAPYTLRARLLLKEVWRIHGQHWDDELPIDIKTKFFAWHSGLPSLGKLKLKRSYFTAPVECVESHIFGDSSEEIFCGVIFLRARFNTSLKTQVAFIFWKSKSCAHESTFHPEA